MKLFSKIKETAFILKAVPPLRLMYTSTIALIVMIFIEFLMFLLSVIVKHNNNGFIYFLKGIYFILVDSRKEPNSEQGFIFAAAILGYLPSIVVVFIIYVAFVKWFKNYKLKTTRFYNELWSDKINLYFNLAHLLFLAAILTLIPLMFVAILGGDVHPLKTITYLSYFASNDFKSRVLGAFAMVYLFMGLPCTALFILIIIIWLIYLAIVYIAKGIAFACSYVFNLIFRRGSGGGSKSNSSESYEDH